VKNLIENRQNPHTGMSGCFAGLSQISPAEFKPILRPDKILEKRVKFCDIVGKK